MRRLALGLIVALIAATALAATQYGRVSVAASATIDHLTKDVQFVAHDFAPEPDVCGSGGDRVLCWDTTTFDYSLTLGTWSQKDVKVFSAAFGIANAELLDVVIDRIVCTDILGALCTYTVISAHPDANLYCHSPGAPWQVAGADAGCVPYWSLGAEVAAGTWTLEASDAATTGYVGGGGELVYGTPGGATYTSSLGVGVWLSAGGDQPSTSGATTHMWVEFAMDFTSLPLARTGTDAVGWSATLSITFAEVKAGVSNFLGSPYSCSATGDYRAMVRDPASGTVYQVAASGGAGVLCSWDAAGSRSGTAVAGLTVASPRAALFNPVDGRVYIVGDDRDFVAYDPGGGGFTNLEPSLVAVWAAAEDIFAIRANAAGDVFLAGENREFVRWNLATGTVTDLEPALTAAGWAGGSEIFSIALNGAGSVYLGGTNRDFMRWNAGPGTATNLEAALALAAWTGGDDILAMVFDNAGIVQLAGENRGLASFSPGPGTATNREPLITGFWMAAVEVRALAYDTANDAVYLGGDNGEFARFNVAGPSATDVQPAIIGFWGTTAGAPVSALAYDPGAAEVYLAGGGGRLATFDPALGTGPAAADDLRSRRLVLAAPGAGSPTSVTDAVAAATQQVDDGANPADSWSQAPKNAASQVLDGEWSFVLHGCRTAGLASGSIQVRAFRISDDALLATSTGPALAGLPLCPASGSLSWTQVFAGLPVIATGDGIYVQIWVAGTGAAGSITLFFDSASAPSEVMLP